MSTLNFRHPRNFINRELSWLEFNARVLEEAEDVTNPLLERVKFAAIFSGNLDEFFMIRVANLKELLTAGSASTPPDGLTPLEQLEGISARCHELVEARDHVLNASLLPTLREHGLRLLRLDELNEAQLAFIEERFHNEIFPVLTPLTVDPSHPFPQLRNLSSNLIVVFEANDEDELPYAIIQIPSVLEALIELPESEGGTDLLHISDVLRHFVGELFDGLVLKGAWLFRVTRNSDLALEEQEVENLLQDLERELRNRVFRRVVRLEVERGTPDEVLRLLRAGLELTDRTIYEIDGVVDVGSLMGLLRYDRYRHLRDPAFNPRLAPLLNTSGSIFSVLREQDLLLHHPYESFSTVVELLQHAAQDPKVLAIKLTLYRTSGDSVIIQALKQAAENGKQVTAVVELKARFDEKNNIVWARELERAGCHVVYGIVGLKIHCKAALVVRREGGRIRRYVHLATGNYNSATARLYTDIGFLSSDPELGEDTSRLFNILTGYTANNIRDIRDGRRAEPEFSRFVLAPFGMRDLVLERIEDEIRLHSAERPGLIRAKLNSLVDAPIIEALYRASCAGVQVDLLVRGICCLRPGLPGVSENIRVLSVVDRFLEHPRLYYFRHGGADLVYASSADWMPRNLDRRIEVMFPIDAEGPKRRVIDEILGIALADNVKARRLLPDGRYVRVPRAEGEPRLRSQTRFIELAREAGLKSEPYDDAVREARRARRHRTRTERTGRR